MTRLKDEARAIGCEDIHIDLPWSLFPFVVFYPRRNVNASVAEQLPSRVIDLNQQVPCGLANSPGRGLREISVLFSSNICLAHNFTKLTKCSELSRRAVFAFHGSR